MKQTQSVLQQLFEGTKFPAMQKFVTLSKTVEEKQLAFGVVYAPDEIDTHGDFMTAEDIEKMAYAFMTSGNVNKIDTQHDLIENGSRVVESFIARAGDIEFPEGAWVMGVHIPDGEIWKSIKNGDLTGFSMYGTAKKREVLIEIN